MQGTIWCTNIDLQIGFILQVTVLLYKEDYLVYKIKISFILQVQVLPDTGDYLVYQF